MVDPLPLDPFLATPFDVLGWLGGCDLAMQTPDTTTREDHRMTQFDRGMNGILQTLDANVPAPWALFEIVINSLSQFTALAEHGIASPKVRSFERFEQLRDRMHQAQKAVEQQNHGTFRIVVSGILNEFGTAAPAA